MKFSLAIIFTAVLIGFLSRSFVGQTFFLSHDIHAHVTRAQAYTAAIKEGQFPVRYIGWAFDGVGSPIFNHYPIGFYTFVALLQLTGLNFRTAFYGVVWFSWISIGIGIALILKRYGKWSALIGALSWWISPYAAMEIYLRAAYPELLAILWGVISLYALEVNRWRLLSLSLALLITTHPPTALLFSPIFIGLVIIRRQSLSKIFWTGIMSLGLSAFYILPSLAELEHVQSDQLRQGYYHYQWHFLTLPQLFTGTWSYGYSNPGINEDASFKFAYGQWAIIFFSVIFLISSKLNSRSKILLFYLIAFVCMTVISLYISQPMWDIFPLLSFIQYPWRSHLIATISVAIIAGMVMTAKSAWYRLIIALAVTAVGIETVRWFQPFSSLQIPPANISSHQPPYPQIGIEEAYTPVNSNITAVKNVPLWQLNADGLITPLHTASTNLEAMLQLPSSSQLTLKRWWYPGWKAEIDARPVAISSNQNGLITVQAPAGLHKIHVTYGGTILQQVSNVMSVISGTILALSALYHLVNQPAVQQLPLFVKKFLRAHR